MSRAVVLELEGELPALAGRVRGGCLECGADVPYERTAPEGVPVPIRCPACGFELELRRLPGGRAAVRRPYGCRRFCAVESTNLAAVGWRDEFLVVRFRGGGVYRYAGAAGIFYELIRAESKGRFFHRRIRGEFAAERLCARYGCFRPAKVATSQVLCPDCLARAAGIDRSGQVG